jgi:hypothetical protein
MAFTEDLTVFLDDDDFAVAATYDGATSVTGIFDNDYGAVLGGNAAIAGAVPAFICRAADVAADPRGKALTVSSTAYTVRDFQADGTGMMTLILERN